VALPLGKVRYIIPLTYAVADPPSIALAVELKIVNVFAFGVITPNVRYNFDETPTELVNVKPALLLIVKLFTDAGKPFPVI